jgi:YggT family protein
MSIVVYIIDRIISIAAFLIILVVFVSSILSFFLDPFHPLRRTLDRIVNPMLAPIRRVIHPMGGFDLSPLVLIILVEVVSYLFRALLRLLL